MPKINIDSAYPDAPRVEVGWSRETGHVQVSVGGTAALDAAGTARLIRALGQAGEQVFGKPTRPPFHPTEAIGRDYDLTMALS